MKDTVFKLFTLFLILCTAQAGFAMNENSNNALAIDLQQVHKQLGLPSLLGSRTANEADLNSNDQGKQTTSPAKKVRITRVIEPQVEMVDIAKQLLELDHKFDGNNDNNNDDDADQEDDQPQLSPSALNAQSPIDVGLNLSVKKVKKTYLCETCNDGKDWKYASALAAHMHTHTGAKPYKCTWEGCGKTFSTSRKRKDHMCYHTKEYPFMCPHEGCPNGYTRPVNLENHIHNKHSVNAATLLATLKNNTSRLRARLNHMSDDDNNNKAKKPYLCEICNDGKSWGSQSVLTIHMRTHTGEKSFKCEYPDCKLAFSRKQYLTTHSYSHTTDKKPFKCPHEGCKYPGSTRKYDRDKHVRIMHTDERPWKCDVSGCGAAYAHSSGLIRHATSNHTQDAANLLVAFNHTSPSDDNNNDDE